MKLLQLSDTHFGTVQAPVRQALQELVQQEQPDVLVLSGDITQRASAQQFAEARAFCDSLSIALFLSLPGNHDIPLFNVFERLFRPYARYLDAFGPELEPSITLPELLLLGVNTTRWWRHKDGEVSNIQIERVVRALENASAQQLRVVVVHQPVHVLRQKDEHDRLHNWHSAVTRWKQAGADIIMGGHIHLPYVRELACEQGGAVRRIWCVQAGTALSSRVRQSAPNSVNIVHYRPTASNEEPPVCDVEQWDYRAMSRRFTQVQTTQLALARGDAH